MKKTILTSLIGLISLTMLTSLNAGDTIVPADEHLRINSNDIFYRFNFNSNKCEKLSFEYRTWTIDRLRQKSAIIDEKFVNDSGIIYYISYELDSIEYQMVVSNTFGSCRLFDDYIIKGKEVDIKNYINLTDTK